MEKLNVSAAPHIHSGASTNRIMLDVIIALLPVSIASVVIFGMKALVIIAACVITAVIAEFLFNKIVGKKSTIGDLSAVVTGLLLALNLSTAVPVWQCVVGTLFAIVCVKCIFGGLGCNVVNPAITARVFMLIAFGAMAKVAFPVSVDAVSSATPLELIKNEAAPSLIDLLLGKKGGAIGETCTLALIIGGIYLIARRVITWHIPVTMIATVFIFSFIIEDFSFISALSWTMSGGLFIGAIFMATDYVTSPSTAKGKIIFALGCAVITTAIRFYGSFPEGVSFSILFMNILNPYIDKWTMKKPFGGVKA